MNRSTLRKIAGDLWTRKGRTALVAISIFIGVVGVVTLITGGDLLVKQLRSDIQEEDLPMLSVFVTVPPNAGDVTLDNATYLQALQQAFPQITTIEGQANNPFFWKREGESRFREAQLLAYSDGLDAKALEPMRLVEGQYPQPGQQQIAVELRMADDFDLKVGQSIDLRILGDPALPTETWTISGIVFHPYNDNSALSMYVAYPDAALITGVDGVNILAMRFTDFEAAKTQQNDVQTYIAQNTPYSPLFMLANDPAKNSSIQTVQQFADILAALAVVAMLVAGFLVLNVINNLVVEQRRQIGVMKSLGATRREIFVIYGGIAFAYGFMGTIPGVLVGIPLGYKTAVLIGDFANTLIDQFAVSPFAIVLGLVLGLVVPVVTAIIPVIAGTRVTILEAMTDMGIGGSYKVGLLNRAIKRAPLPLNVKQSLNNLTQKKVRLALTVVTLMFAVTAFMGVSAVFVQINNVLQDILNSFEFQVILQTTKSQSYDTVETILTENVDGISEVRPGSFSAVQIAGYYSKETESSQVIMQGIDPAMGRSDQNLVEGTGWQDDPTREGVILAKEITDQIGKHVGDMITLSANGKTLDLELIGILNYPFAIGVMPWQDLARFTGYTLGAPTPNQYFAQAALEGYSGTLPDSQITAWGIDAQAAAFVTMVAGAPITPGQPGVMLSEAAAEDGGYQVGDTLTFTTEAGTQTVPVTGIFTLPAQLASTPLPADIAALYWEDLAQLEGTSLDGEPVPNAFYVLMTAKDPSARQVDEMIEHMNETLVDHGITASYTNMVQIADQASRAILSIGVVLNIASAIMAAVGAIGLITTLSIAVFERQKEIGVMRSIGARSPTIVSQFLAEGVLVGILAWIVAVPLSVLLAWGLTSILPFGDFIAFSYPPVMLPLGLVGILVIAAVASVWPSLSAARKTVSDILRYQ